MASLIAVACVARSPASWMPWIAANDSPIVNGTTTIKTISPMIAAAAPCLLIHSTRIIRLISGSNTYARVSAKRSGTVTTESL